MTMTLVETVTVGSGGAASIEFTGIAGTGKDLLVLLSGRQDGSGNLVYELNGSAYNSGNYSGRELFGNGSTVTSSTNTDSEIGRTVYSTHTASTFGNALLYISNYTSTSNKSVSADFVTENNATTAFQGIYATSFTSSSAITSVKLLNVGANFVQHSTASLYLIS